MSMQNKQNVGAGRNARGFSLVELLVVIAVIAILAAIIFPVFSQVREKARQGNVLSNYQKISKALASYQQDNGHPPKVLFAYADNAATMQGARALPPGGHYDGLYPNYINDISVFKDQNNDAAEDAAPVSLKVNTLDTNGALAVETHKFFPADSLDISPLVTANNTIDATTLVPRYQSAWTDVTNPQPALVTPAEYKRQLVFGNNADGGSYVTCDTYHVKQANMILVLFKDGSAKAIDASKMLANGGDKSDIGVANGVSPATCWKYTANGF
jgi:prepilin-type N-terminal cleavage/methylation domain-containing protein